MAYSSSDHIALMREVFPMAIKGISLTCLGDFFRDESKLDHLSTAYHKCWREMEVRMHTDARSSKDNGNEADS